MIMSAVLSPDIAAKDFGVQGHLFEILEPDLLSQIEEKLVALDESGELKIHQQKRGWVAATKTNPSGMI